MTNRQRILWIIAIALAVFVLGLLTGCANTLVPRQSFGTPEPGMTLISAEGVLPSRLPPDGFDGCVKLARNMMQRRLGPWIQINCTGPKGELFIIKAKQQTA
jgi:hypothetical protein